MIKAKIIVKGEVQKVGYRDLVQKTARQLGVKGYVENLRDGNVQIICEADDRVLADFVKRINIKDELIVVENINIVEKSETAGEFEFFEIEYGKLEDELGERLGTAVEYARTTNQTMKAMHEDIKGTRTDIKTMNENLGSSINSMHTDLKSVIKDMHVDLKGDLGEIKEAVENMHTDLKTEVAGVRNEIGCMRGEMNERFEEMAKRYDSISTELVRTREELTRAVDGLLKVIEEFLHQR